MTKATLKAKDVYEAARITHNRILQARFDRADEYLERLRGFRYRWRFMLREFSVVDWVRCRRDLLEHDRRIKLYPEQFLAVRIIMALCEGAMRMDKDADIEIDYSDMSSIEVGWQAMIKKEEEKDKPTSGVGGSEDTTNDESVAKAEWPKKPDPLLFQKEPLLTDVPAEKKPPQPLAPSQED